jgi:predicted phosphoribosyltransferase
VNLEQLEKRLESKRAELARDQFLPASILGATQRSGESIREENVTFYNDSFSTAHAVSEILTEGIEQYSKLSKTVDAVPVTVAPNMQFLREVIVQNLVMAVTNRFIPAFVAVREAQKFFPTFSDEEMQEYIEILKKEKPEDNKSI